MGSSTKRLAVMAVLALAAGLTPASAFHADDLPQIAGETGLGNGWRSYTVTTDGSEYAIDVVSPNVSKAAQAGGFFYTASNQFAGGFVFTGFPGKDGALVRIGNGDDVNVNTQSSPAGGLMGLGFGFNDPSFPPPFVGTWKIVLWWASEGATWDWSFRAAPGTTIDATESGSSAYLAQSADFTSAAQAEAYQQSVGARASVAADLAVNVSDTLIGFYQMGITSAGTLSVTTPKGEQQCGLAPVVQPFVLGGICLFADMQGGGRNGPGTYTFHTTSAGAGFAGAFDDVWFGGADARLPA